MPAYGDAVALRDVQEHFRQFADAYPELSLYSRLARAVADDDETASLLMDAAPGQRRPVLWLAALHDLVLREPDLPIARWYPSVTGTHEQVEGDPWPKVRRTVLDHADELGEVMRTRSTQTNEVNRSVYVAALLSAAAADLSTTPVVLLELGASAGLLLQVDRYRTDIGDTTLGDPDSAVHCRGQLRAPAAVPMTVPRIAGRAGLDRSPVDLADQDRVRWLEACLWPEVEGRVERFRAAVRVAREHPVDVVRGDIVDDLPAVAEQALASAFAGAHLVVLTSWALTYVEPHRRVEVAAALESVAADRVPVTWATAEPPGCVPGIPDEHVRDGGVTSLGLRRWRGGHEASPALVGTAHPHGAWIAPA
ncbi:DUF2332 domain-containing protein [Luteipulveratus sp. YIM 133132]|uniref:DUF2332 domain-containing protein n=1 Tax=Luteipulveratus flavus TaxID=3031728 RepID=UPI0023AF1F42|nr:DUF2332 domain-containing protein [Luteipulveratus sp. YIM 133132]MDE9366334.1 DUF2332 domain-containing protein [Luteipulveratus sp. YIM 133132]